MCYDADQRFRNINRSKSLDNLSFYRRRKKLEQIAEHSKKKYKSHDIDILLQPDERAVNLFPEVQTNLLYSLIEEAKHLSGLSVSFRLQCTYFENWEFYDSLV